MNINDMIVGFLIAVVLVAQDIFRRRRKRNDKN